MNDKEKLINYLQSIHISTELTEALLQWYTEVAVPNKYRLNLITDYKLKDLFAHCKTEQEQVASVRKAVHTKGATFKSVSTSDITVYGKPQAGKEEVNPPVAPPDEEEEVLGELMEPTCVVEYTQFIHRIKMPTDEVLMDLYKSEREILYQCLYYGLGVRKKITERLKELLSEDEYSQLKTEFSEWRNTYMNTYGIDLDVLHPPKAMIDSRTSELKPSPPENTVEWFQYHYDGYVDYQGLKHRKPRKDIF